MKKTFVICLALLMFGIIAQSNAEDRNLEFYSEAADNIALFYTKMQKCSPMNIKGFNEKIYGRTKNGLCHYSYTENEVEHHCLLPMKVALGYGSTAYDTIDYSKNSESTLADERLQQNNEIRKIMYDYCN